MRWSPRFGCTAAAVSLPVGSGAKRLRSLPICLISSLRRWMKSVQRFETQSAEETRAVGTQIAHMLPDKAVVLLIGELGAGKTTLTKGIVEGRRAASPD